VVHDERRQQFRLKLAANRMSFFLKKRKSQFAGCQSLASTFCYAQYLQNRRQPETFLILTVGHIVLDASLSQNMPAFSTASNPTRLWIAGTRKCPRGTEAKVWDPIVYLAPTAL
jgi:hypothetical protein